MTPFETYCTVMLALVIFRIADALYHSFKDERSPAIITLYLAIFFLVVGPAILAVTSLDS